MEGQMTLALPAGRGKVGEGPGRQIVHHGYVVSFGEKPVDQRRAYESGASGDQSPHDGGGRRAPLSAAPGSTMNPAPVTDSSQSLAPAPTAPPGPTIESIICAPSPTRAPSRSSDLLTTAPGPTLTESPRKLPLTSAPEAMEHEGPGALAYARLAAR